MSEDVGRPGRKRRGRRARGAESEAAEQITRSTDYRNLVNPFPPICVFSDDQIAHIHNSALRVLEELGIKVLLARAREIYRKAGAKVDESSQMVYFERGLIEQSLASAPAQVKVLGGTPARNITLGGPHVSFAAVGGAPYAMDTDKGKRPGTLADFRIATRLSQTFDVIHFPSGAPEPQDIPVQFRHLEINRVQLLDSDKIPFVYSRGVPQVRDCFEMIKRARGIRDDDEFRRGVYCKTIINSNSPRALDIPMANGIIDFAEMRQLSVITPFCLSGAMAPVTLAGALTLQHAEALAAIALGQMVSPGAPMLYGSFSSNVDLKSGSPAFGTPEHVRSLFGAGQLARHIDMPWRSGAGTAANAVDAQATYETSASLWAAIMSGSDMVVHAAGWMEGGLSASFEKFIIDVEMLQGFAEMFAPARTDGDEIAFDAIAEVAPSGHFFDAAHTMARYRTAFYEPLVSDWRNYGQWSADGSRTATERANGIWKKTIAEFEPPPIDVAIRDAINDYADRRTSEGGAPPES